MNRDQKVAAVAQLSGAFAESPTMFVAEFQGLDMPRMNDLRERLRQADASFQVVKNTLARRAAAEAGLDELSELFNGPTAIAFVQGDAAAVAKALKDFTRANKDVLAFRGGIMDGLAVTGEQVNEIAELPAREVILAMLLSAVNSPLTQLVGVLDANQRDILLLLDAYIEKRKAEEGEG